MRSEHSRFGVARNPAPAPFDFTQRMRKVCEHIIARTPELAHVDLSRVALSFCQARNRTTYGIYASLTPLRFRDGSLVEKRRGRSYTVQRLHDCQNREMLYILSFYLPRFMDLDLIEKLTTILHELWHVSPQFNGDIRRHAGRCYAHTHSQAQYDAQMAELGRRWLATQPPEALWSFLRLNFEQLFAVHGRVVGVKIRRPRLIPVAPA